jgi:hypothetical protein
MIRILCTMALVLTSTLPLSSQARPPFSALRHSAAPSAPSPTLAPYSPSPRALYQPRMTWYEFLLHQLNPHDRDYGVWYRERRAALVEASIRSQYFWYSFWATVTIIFLVAGLLKSLYDRRKERRIMDDMMAEVKSHDAYSRQAAHEAIKRYNDHIELCNRVIEMSEAGEAAVPGDGSQPTSLKVLLDAEKQKVSGLESERLRLETELKEKATLVTDLSHRLDAVSKQIGSNGSDPSAPSMAEMVRQINSLEQQLYAEHENNRRLKEGR